MATIPANAAARLTIDHVPMRQPFGEDWRARLRTFVLRRIFQSTAREVAALLDSGDRDAWMRAAPALRTRARRFGALGTATMTQALDGVRVTPASGMPAAATWFESDAFDDEGVIVYVPGGSFVIGESPRQTALIARVAKAASARACAVAYRLAPEHPCPAAVEDVERVIAELIEGGARVVLLAESAGAAIALAAAQRLHARRVALAGICLLSPWTDLALTGLSFATRSASGQSALRMEFLAMCVHLYLQGRSPVDPVASPVYGDLSGLPPLLVHTAKGDAFHDDARSLADRVHRAGSDVTLRIWPGGEHVFEQGFNPQSVRAIAEVAAFIRARLDT